MTGSPQLKTERCPESIERSKMDTLSSLLFLALSSRFNLLLRGDGRTVWTSRSGIEIGTVGEAVNLSSSRLHSNSVIKQCEVGNIDCAAAPGKQSYCAVRYD